MKISVRVMALMLAFGAPIPSSAGEQSDEEICLQARRFLDSVGPGEERAVTLHTIWGGNFRDDTAASVAAKRCTHDGYVPGEELCTFLMTYASIEFPGSNVKAVLGCLLGGKELPLELEIQSGSFSVTYGSGVRGAFVNLSLSEDQEIGGKAFRISASGY